jgi:aryl-alcohol dehydrogenase-like predicted oxidoreductase
MTRHATRDKQESSSYSARQLTGYATPEGTLRFASRFADSFAPDFYRESLQGLKVSSLGMGTYLGECDDAEDERYTRVIATGIERGLNLIDTAINYRCQRSERAVGKALESVLSSGRAKRDEIVVCTKGGFVPLEGAPPPSRAEYDAYLEDEFFSRGIMSRKELVAGGHCITPHFIADQIARSRKNLGIDCIDLYYLHNPETQLDVLDRASFLSVIRDAFSELESHVASGHIAAYGCATWNGFRVFAANRNYLSLPELLDAANDAGGDNHHFRAIQLPVNLAMTEAVRAPAQSSRGRNIDILSLAEESGISVFASASLMQGQLTQNLPAAVTELFPTLVTDAQKALAFVRSLPVTAALAGMKSTDHLNENLGSAAPVIQA